MGKITNKQWDVIVIGAGASGMMTAITAARNGKKVIILERLDKAGKKLLATGNGKCNFTNSNMSISCFHGEHEFIEKVLKRFSVEDCLSFFKSIGIFPKCKNGYFYPNSEQASSVTVAFEQALKELNISCVFNIEISKIEHFESVISLETNAGIFHGNKLVIATGLLASPKLGSDGSLFEQINALGHTFSPVLPALCGFYCKGIRFNKIQGVRAHGIVSAMINGEVIAEDCGEIQFTDYGLSGIPIFQISRHLSKGLYANENVEVKINLLPEFRSEQLKEELFERKNLFKNYKVSTYLNGLLNQKLADMFFDKMGIEGEEFVFSLNDSDIEQLCYLIQNLKVKVTKPRDFEFAQICTGGIPTKDIDVSTMESKIVPKVYFVGEIIDVDGICGGYNLHFAWATGYIAGQSI